MKVSDLRIIIDEREKKSGIPKLLSAIGIKTEIKTLLVGDYIVGPETIIERKSIQDLLSSVFDGRLFDQCSRLKENFQNPILLIEGNVDEIELITENPLIFYGALATIAMVTGLMPVVGVPLPLLSYGGTAMLSIMISFGLLLNVNVNDHLKKLKNQII